MSKNLKVKLTIDADGNVKESLRGVNKQVGQLDGKVQTADASTKQLTQTVRTFGGIAAGAFAGIGLVSLAGQVIDATKEFQSLKASLVTVTGSVYAADIAFADIQAFAAETPFQLTEVTRAFIQMQSLGLDPSERAMRSYGDTSSAMGKSLNQMVEAVADAATGEFERLKEFGIKASSQGDRVTFTFKGVATEVGKNSKEIEDYLIALGETNFAGGMARQMETVGGQLSNLEDSWAKAFNAIGEGSEPAITLAIAGMSSLAGTVEELAGYMDEAAYLAAIGLSTALTAKAIPAMYGMATATTVAGVAGKGFIVTTRAMTVAALAFAATPLGLAVMAMGGAVTYLALRTDEAGNANKELSASARALNVEMSSSEMDKRSQQLVGYRQELDALIKLKKSNQSVDVLGIKQSDLQKRITDLIAFKDVLKDTLKLTSGNVGLDLSGEYAQINISMLNERLKLEQTLFKLTATTSEKREKALSLLNVENQYIQKNIWAVQDKALAQKEYNKLLKEQNKELDLSLNKAIAAQTAMELDWGQQQNDAYDQRVNNQWDKDSLAFDEGDSQDALLFETLDMANSVDLVGDAWTRTGNKALDAMGSMAAVLAKNNASEVKFAKQQAKLDQTKWADNDDYVAASLKLDEARVKNSLKGSLTMLDASVAMYQEGSDAQKMAHQASLVFHSVEMAMNLQKAISAATVAVANQGQGDPYTAFARIGAMSIMMAGLLSQIGASFGGTSGSVANVASLGNPDGSVLGSTEASESLTNVNDLLAGIEADQYVELRAINKEMQALNRNLTGFVSSLYRTGDLSGLAGDYTASVQSNSPFDVFADIADMDVFGNMPILGTFNDVIGGWVRDLGSSIFGSTKQSVSGYGLSVGDFKLGGDADLQSYTTIKKKTDGGWFGKSKTSYSTRYSDINGESERLLNTVFDSLRGGMVEFGDVLDRDVAKQVDDFTVSIGSIETYGKTSAEVEQAFSESISNESDRLAYAIFGDLVDSYAQLNEGAFETVSRLGVEKAVVSDLLSNTGQTMVGDAIELSQSLIEVAGGLDALTSAASSYYDAFFSDSEKALRNYESLNRVLSDQNLILPDSVMGYRELVEAMDLSTQAGQDQYVTLLEMSESAADYYDYIAKSQAEYYDAQIDAAQQTIGEYQNLKDSLERTYSTITGVGTAGALDYANAQVQLSDALSRAEVGDLPALDDLSSALRVLESNNQGSYASVIDYQRDQAVTANMLDELIGYTDQAITVEDAMLVELQAQTQALKSLSVVAVPGAAIVDGSHYDGLYSVPFDGYNAELHKDESVIDARTMSGLRKYGINASSRSDSALIAEIQSLKKEVVVMREQLYGASVAIANSTAKTSRTLSQWDDDGQPAVRDEVIYASS